MRTREDLVYLQWENGCNDTKVLLYGTIDKRRSSKAQTLTSHCAVKTEKAGMELCFVAFNQFAENNENKNSFGHLKIYNIKLSSTQSNDKYIGESPGDVHGRALFGCAQRLNAPHDERVKSHLFSFSDKSPRP